MGNMCSCNLANKINGIVMTLLAICAGIMYFWEFHVGLGLEPGTSCTEVSDIQENQLCQGRIAAGTMVTIAALTALLGGCSVNPERNQATVSAAFGLLNLAKVVELWTQTSIEGYEYFAGLVNILGALFGIGFALWTCRSGYQTNNLAFILSIAMYALAFTFNTWSAYNAREDCGDKSIENQIDPNVDPLSLKDTDSCTTLAFQGVFSILAMLFCLFAIVQICCQRSVQPKVQQFIICCSIGWIFAIYTTVFWFNFSNADVFGENACSNNSSNDEKDGFCGAMFLGGLISVIGMPLSLVSGLMFCLGCFVKEEDERVAAHDNDKGYNTFGV